MSINLYIYIYRSINAITREINPKDKNFIKYRIDEAFTLILLSVLVYHFTILLMFISFIRSPDYNFIIYKICYITVFELIPLFSSCLLLFLRWKENLKPIVLKISNYVLYFTMVSLLAWVYWVFHLIWGNEFALNLTKNYTPIIICRVCAALIILLGIIAVVKVPSNEFEQLYETKKLEFSKLNNSKPNNVEQINENGKTYNNETSTEKNENENESKKDL